MLVLSVLSVSPHDAQRAVGHHAPASCEGMVARRARARRTGASPAAALNVGGYGGRPRFTDDHQGFSQAQRGTQLLRQQLSARRGFELAYFLAINLIRFWQLVAVCR